MKTKDKVPFRKWLELVIKGIIVILLMTALYYQVIARENIDEIQEAFLKHFHSENLYWLWITVGLMPINWALETLKWQVLIRQFEQLSFFKAYKGILSGITFGMFTPNRVGEYGGRVLLVRPENNMKAVFATLVGSFCQLLMLLSFGFVGLIYFGSIFFELDAIFVQGLSFLGIVMVSIMFFCFYNIDLIIPIIKRIPFIHYFKSLIAQVQILRNYTSRDLSLALLYAGLRYITYTLQYYFILKFFGINAPFWIGCAGIATIYLLQTSIPLPPLIGLLARGQIALYVWEHYTNSQIDILAATFGLFMLNLILPALLGLLVILSTNLLYSLGWGGLKKSK